MIAGRSHQRIRGALKADGRIILGDIRILEDGTQGLVPLENERVFRSCFAGICFVANFKTVFSLVAQAKSEVHLVDDIAVRVRRLSSATNPIRYSVYSAVHSIDRVYPFRRNPHLNKLGEMIFPASVRHLVAT